MNPEKTPDTAPDQALADHERAKTELRAAEERLRAHSLFVANLLHDLRTPINAVVGFAEMIEGSAFGPHSHPKYQEYGALISEAGRIALGLAERLVEIERNEADPNAIRPTIEPVEVANQVRVVMRLVADQARKAGIHLRESISPNLPKIMSDPELVRRVLMNLVGNAVRFTPKGGRVTVSARPDAARGVIVLVIADTGVGMSPGQLVNVLKPFHVAESKGANSGFGLGLPLVKQLVAALGGTIDIGSRLGVGTSVTITLPHDFSALSRS